MAFERRKPISVPFQSPVNPQAEVALMQRKAQIDQENDRFREEQKVKSIESAVNSAASLVSTMVQTSKQRQKQNFVSSLADSLSVLNPKNADAIKLATRLAPETAAKEFLEQQLPSPSSGHGGFQQSRYLDDAGQVRLATFNSATGEYVRTPEDPIAGYAPKAFTDQFGNPILSPAAPGRGGVAVSTPSSRSQNLTKTPEQIEENAIPNLRAKAPKLADAFDKAYIEAFPQGNKELATAVNAAASTAAVKSILGQKDVSQTALAGLGFHLARMSGSNSQLSDAEREIFQEPLALLDKVVNKGYKMTKGDLSPKMRADLGKLAEVLDRKERARGNRLIMSAKRQAKGSVGSFWNEGLSKQFPTIDELVTSLEDIGQIGDQSQPSQSPQKPMNQMSTDELLQLLEQD